MRNPNSNSNHTPTNHDPYDVLGDDAVVLPNTGNWPCQVVAWREDPGASEAENAAGRARIGQTGLTTYAVLSVRDGAPIKLWHVIFPDGESLYCWQDDLRFD